MVEEAVALLTPSGYKGSPAVESYPLFVAALRLVTKVPGAKQTKYRPPVYMAAYYAQVWLAAARQTVELPPYVTGTVVSVWFEALGQQLAQNMGQHVLTWWQQARRLARASLSCALQQAWLHQPSGRQRRPLEQAACGSLLKGDACAVFATLDSVFTAAVQQQQQQHEEGQQQHNQHEQQLQHQRARLAAAAHSHTIRSCQSKLQRQAADGTSWQDRLMPLTDAGRLAVVSSCLTAQAAWLQKDD